MLKAIKGLELTTAKKWRGITRASIIHLEDWVLRLETKQLLSHSDHLTVQRLSKRIEELCTELREYHYVVVDQTEQEDVVTRAYELLWPTS